MRSEVAREVRARWYSKGRLLILGLALVSVAAALAPDVALSPLNPYLEMSRTPERSARAMQILLWACAGVMTLAFSAWSYLSRTVLALAASLGELSERRFWLLTLAAAGGLRIVVAVLLEVSPGTDSGWYHEAAVSLSRGEGLKVDGEPTAYRFPGYPLLLSLTYRWFGPRIELAWVWGLLATLASIVLVYRLSLALHGRLAARIAAVTLAVYPATVLRTGQAMSDLPFVAGVLLLTVTLLRRGSHRLPWVLVIGVLLAGLTLTRGVALGLVLVVVAIWLVRGVRPGRAVVALAVASMTLMVGVAPWALRNRALFDRTVLSTNVGLNFFLGNYKGASGGYLASNREYPEVAFEWLNPAETDLELLHLTKRFLMEHPLQLVTLAPRKLFHLYALETTAVTQAFQGNEHLPAELKYAAYGVSQLAYLALFLVFFCRILDLSRRRNRPQGDQWVSWLMIGYFTFVALVFFGQDRYRLPILPFMLIESAALVEGGRRSSRDPITLLRRQGAGARPDPPGPSRA